MVKSSVETLQVHTSRFSRRLQLKASLIKLIDCLQVQAVDSLALHIHSQINVQLHVEIGG